MSGDSEITDRPTLRLIHDEPAEQDFFTTHTKLAGAIASAIRANAGTRVVGLLGKWGSGKSTVIRYLTEELEKMTTTKSGQAWLDANHADVQKWVKRAPAPARDALQARLDAQLQSKRDETRYWAEVMRTRLLGKK